MTTSSKILTRRRMFQAGAGLVTAAAASPLLAPSLGRAADAPAANPTPLNGNGFYRFKIGEFRATVISDGYGEFPGRPNSPRTRLLPISTRSSRRISCSRPSRARPTCLW